MDNGFEINGTIMTMTGNWWIGIGESDTWTWYLSTDKKSFLTSGGSVFIKQ